MAQAGVFIQTSTGNIHELDVSIGLSGISNTCDLCTRILSTYRPIIIGKDVIPGLDKMT